jgi:hypothetical protein
VIGYLHTAPVHTATFRALTAEVAPEAGQTHAVDASLLEHARARGLDDVLRERVLVRLAELRSAGARVVVCTCSTISGLAEDLAGAAGVRVLRVDRPMAQEAVRAGGRIAVVAALAATVEPTVALLTECAREAGTVPEIRPALCPAAWALFEAGDLDGYARAVAGHVRGLAATADVIVLAQASMAPAVGLLDDLNVPVLTSPRLSVAAAAGHLSR